MSSIIDFVIFDLTDDTSADYAHGRFVSGILITAVELRMMIRQSPPAILNGENLF
jgi:hypothetical protein